MREFHITCFWDSMVNDHVIEVKRVRGDGLQPLNTTDIFAKLKTKLCKQCTTSSTDHTTNNITASPMIRRGKLRGPLPLPNLKLLSSLKANNTTTNTSQTTSNTTANPTTNTSNDVTKKGLSEEQFIKSILPIVHMISDHCFEPRLEAARMLCDLAIMNKHSTEEMGSNSSAITEKQQYLTNTTCRTLVMKALKTLITDDFEDVKQFAVVAFEAFTYYEAYQVK